jgi:hypothetical protein
MIEMKEGPVDGIDIYTTVSFIMFAIVSVELDFWRIHHGDIDFHTTKMLHTSHKGIFRNSPRNIATSALDLFSQPRVRILEASIPEEHAPKSSKQAFTIF